MLNTWFLLIYPERTILFMTACEYFIHSLIFFCIVESWCKSQSKIHIAETLRNLSCMDWSVTSLQREYLQSKHGTTVLFLKNIPQRFYAILHGKNWPQKKRTIVRISIAFLRSNICTVFHSAQNRGQPWIGAQLWKKAWNSRYSKLYGS